MGQPQREQREGYGKLYHDSAQRERTRWGYEPRVKWHKIKNPDYSQKEGRADLFDRSNRQRPWRRDEPYRADAER
jgi:hypothetical protein